MKELINLKNKIPPKTENDEDNKDGRNKSDTSNILDIKSKSKILIFFKDIMTNLEKINEYMEALRNKGSSLPIKNKYTSI